MFDLAQRLVVMGLFGAGDGGGDSGQIEFDRARIERIGGVAVLEKALQAGIAFDKRAMGRFAAGHAQVSDGFGVHGEKAGGGSVFGGHVG